MRRRPPTPSSKTRIFIVAHLHYVLFGGSIFAIFAGIYYWWPKMTGRLLSDSLGKVHFWLTFIAFNITFFPMHFLGLDGMPRRIYTYDSAMGWDLWNIVATAGAFMLGASTLLFLYNVFRSLRKGELAGNDPWDGRTLEWSMSSPPPVYNFATIPRVHSRDAYWEEKYGNGEHIVPIPVSGGSVSNGDSWEHGAGQVHTSTAAEGDIHEEGHLGIHMPSLSYYPVLVALGFTMAGYGVLFESTLTWALAAVGGAIAMVSVYAWSFEPASDGPEPEEE